MARFSSKLSPKLELYKSKNSGGGLFQDVEEVQLWKLPEMRQELFNRYFRWRVLSHDLDHIHYYKYLCKDYDFEQKVWFAFAFGMTYRTPQAFAYTETFKDFHATSIEEVEKWNSENWKRTTYGTDARYNKGHFASQFASLKNWLHPYPTFESKLQSILVGSTSRENFWNLYQEIQSLHKFGRMTGWLVMQALHDLLSLPIDPEDIMLDGYSPNNDSSLGSIWNGLCALTNQPTKMIGKYGTYQVTPTDTEWAKEALLEYTSTAETAAGFKIDSFRKESIYCQYKRLWGDEGSKEYPGHASGDAASRYLYYAEHWPEIDWSSFRSALRSQPGIVKGKTFVDWHNSIFGVTGIMMNMHELYPDMPNGYELLGEDPLDNRIHEIWTHDHLKVPDSISDFVEELKTADKWYT